MRLFVFGITILFVVFACKKDKVAFLCDCDQLEGRFLTDFHSSSYNSSVSESHYSDVVLEVKVEGNNLTVRGITFEVLSDDQTVFERKDATTGSVSTLTYSNNYQTIVLDIDGGPGGPGLTTTNQTFTGNSTTLLTSVESSSDHPYKSEIEGEYLMWYTKKASQNSNESDTVYQDTFLVTMNSSNVIDIDGTLYGYGQFHSYYSESVNSSASYFNASKSIRWKEDSLFLVDRNIVTYPGAEDTSFVNYKGRKL